MTIIVPSSQTPSPFFSGRREAYSRASSSTYLQLLMSEAKAYFSHPSWQWHSQSWCLPVATFSKSGRFDGALTQDQALKVVVYLEAEAMVVEDGSVSFHRSLARSEHLCEDFANFVKQLLNHEMHHTYAHTPHDMKVLLRGAKRAICNSTSVASGSMYNAIKLYGHNVRFHVLAELLLEDPRLRQELSDSSGSGRGAQESRLGIWACLKERYRAWVEGEWEPFEECKEWLDRSHRFI